MNATVTIRFNLSAEQKTVVMIPQGTRVRTAAGIYFATAAYAQIAIGETYVDVLAQAEVVGASGNDVPIGVVDTLVDAIPYVAAVESVDTSSGGADAESDDSLTRRIWLSPTTYSCAGPRDAYEYWAMSFRSDVENAIAVSPRSQPCTVYIFFMLTGGRMPSEKDMSEMQAYLMNEKLDGKTTKIRTDVASGTALTFEQTASAAGFQKILNGNHTITVEVSDGKETVSTSATFTKAVHAASVTLAEPLAVEGDITVAVLQVTGSIPDDAKFKAEVTNNALDSSPVWQDATTEVKKGVNIVFENKTATNGAAFNFRVSVERGESGEGGYIEAVSGAFQ